MTLLSFLAGAFCAVATVAVAWRLFLTGTLYGRVYRVATGHARAMHSTAMGHHGNTCAGCGSSMGPKTVRYSQKLGVMVHGCYKCKAVWTTDTDAYRTMSGGLR